ncbi:MAG: TonB-dependent receptor [Bacteroidales bacterium]|nr:TonB-dependent receptor [Bacteroidales bacterium]
MIRKVFSTIAAAILLTLGSTAAFAQSGHKVSLQLQDVVSGEPVTYATVSLTAPNARSAYKYVLSDDTGKATFEGVRNGKFVLKAELLGYKAYTQDIEVRNGNVELGVIKMDVDQETLDAAKVTDVGNPIVIKKDTIEYNASSYRTTENDMLEDLLKKLPGVEIGDDGSIQVNGKTIDKITVEGKTFFQNDPQMASKNLPAKMVKKIKVIRKKSEQAEFTGIDDGQEQNVLDLSVQDNMMNGTFGNLTAGIGHDIPEQAILEDDYNWGKEGWRFSDNLFAGKFKSNSQLSLIANANNANSMGFGNFSGNMMGALMGGGGGMGGGMGGGGGITTSWMVGANGAWDLFDDRMQLSSNYVYNGSKREVESDSYSKTFNTDGQTAILSNTNSPSINNSYGHRVGIRLEHKFSDNTSILFEPQINFGTGNFNQSSLFDNRFLTDRNNDQSGYKTSDGFSWYDGDNKNVSTSGRFLLRQRLGIPGRTLTFNANYSFSNNTSKGFNQSATNNFAQGDELNPTYSDIVNQRYEQNSKSTSATGTLTYTEPLGGSMYVEANYSINWNKSTSDKDTWNSGEFDPTNFTIGNHLYNPTGEQYDVNYSNNVMNRYLTHTAGVNMLFQSQKFRAQIGMSVMPQNTKNVTTSNGVEKEYKSNVVNWAPRAQIQWNPSDYANVRVNYNGRSSQPSTSQLMPVPDNSNPMRVSFGNPYLKPYFSHNMNTEFRFTNMNNFMSTTFNISGGLNTDPIVNATWNDRRGANYTYPVNGPTTGNFNLRMFLNSPIALSNFSVSNTASASYSESNSFAGKTGLDMTNYYDPETGNFNYEAFHDFYGDLRNTSDFTLNKVKTTNISEQLRFTYRNDFLEIVVGGQTSLRNSKYTAANMNDTKTWSSRLTASFNWTFGMNSDWTIASDANYNWYNGYATNPDPELILNASISKILGTFTISLRAYDLLAQQRSLSITNSDTRYAETRTNTLGRYVLASLTYRFGSFGGRRMGGGGGRGGRGGMGGFGGGFGGGRPPMM